MGVKVITPASAAIPIADLRTHLRTEPTGPDDALILGYLAAAQGFAQHYTGIAIGSQTLELALDSFPSGSIALPNGQVTSITSIGYTDIAGAAQIVSAALYTLNDYSIQCKADLTFGSAWPASRPIPNAVKIRYVAGAALVPAVVISALMLITAHLYEQREEVSPIDLREIPLGAKALLDTVRTWSM